MHGAEFVQSFLEHAREYYVRSDGTQTGFAGNLERALRWWRSIERIDLVGLAQLKLYREELLARGMHRRTVNEYVGRVRSAFRWGAEMGYVSDDAAARLMVLRPLRILGPRARERRVPSKEQLRRVADEARGASGAMMRVQWLCGMRPGEVCAMTWAELDIEDGVGLYTPAQHKNAHRGRRRCIVLLPEALAWLPLRRVEGAVFRTKRGLRYSVGGYRQEVQRACDRLGVTRIRPQEIRAAAATEARRLLGAEHAQRLLGHSSTAMTERYYDLGWIDQVNAARELAKMGWSLA